MRKSLKLLPQHLISVEDDLYQRITRLLVSGGVSNVAEEKEFTIQNERNRQIRKGPTLIRSEAWEILQCLTSVPLMERSLS